MVVMCLKKTGSVIVVFSLPILVFFTVSASCLTLPFIFYIIVRLCLIKTIIPLLGFYAKSHLEVFFKFKPMSRLGEYQQDMRDALPPDSAVCICMMLHMCARGCTCWTRARVRVRRSEREECSRGLCSLCQISNMIYIPNVMY